MEVTVERALPDPQTARFTASRSRLSVAVGVLVGGVQVLGLVREHLDLDGWLVEGTAGLDLATLGYVVVALFVLVWLAEVLVWRFGGLEARWAAAVEHAG